MISRCTLMLVLVFSQPVAGQTARVLRRPASTTQASPAPLAGNDVSLAAAAWATGLAGSVAGAVAGSHLGDHLAPSGRFHDQTARRTFVALGLLLGSAAVSATAVHLVDRKRGSMADALAGAVLGTAAGVLLAGATSGGDLNGLFVMLPVGQASVATLFSWLGHS